MNNQLRLILLEKQNLMLKEENDKLQSNLDYVAMMTDVDIPTEDEEDPDGTFTEI